MPAATPAPRRQRPGVIVHGQWALDPAAAARILAAAPRDAVPLPVAPWACTYGFGCYPARGCYPGHPRTERLDPGPGFDPDRAMTADLTGPLVIAILPAGAGALIIDGADRLYRAHCQGQPALPAFLLTPEESQAITRPARRPRRPRRRGRHAAPRPGTW
jgi:hypothetical protein